MTWLPTHAVARLRAAAEEPDFSGTRLRLLGPLGRGGMGAVWLARDEELGREVAVKVLAQPLADADAGAQARLLHEARILAKLEHPGIVPVHDAGILADGRAWYSMKRVKGRRLDEHVNAGTALAERLRIFERLCETLELAHAHGVLHRDLKPGNVMVGEFGEVLVLDWGVAKLLGRAEPDPPDTSDLLRPDATSPGTIVGTPGFMPPEQAEGRSDEVDERADVWGLGALLHVLLVGRPPQAPMSRERFGGGIARPLEAICRKALARSREERYSDVARLRQDVARFRDGLAVEALPEGPLRTLGRVLAREKIAVGLVLAYLIMRAALAFGLGR